MSAFVQTYSPHMGAAVFGSHMDPATPYRAMTSSSRMSTASPMSRNNTLYQPSPTQISGASFFDEAIDISPIPTGFQLHIASPTPPTRTSEVRANAAPYPPERDTKLTRRVGGRRQSQQSQASSVPSESSTSVTTSESAKPRKRGRKPKKQSNDHKSLGQRDDLDEDDLPKDPRRRRILERNRIAATKCRLRKRDEATALASREQAMEDQNRYLSSCFDSLTAEIYHLKTELLKHTDCNCVLIQKYIANEAKKSVDGLMACPPAFQVYGESMSPEYGSSSGSSSVDSMNLHSPDPDGIPPQWNNPFHQGTAITEGQDEMFDLNLEPFHKASISSSDSVTPGYPIHSAPLSGYAPGFYVNMGTQEHPADELAWDTQWELR